MLLYLTSCHSVEKWADPEFLSSLPKLVESVEQNKNSIQGLQERLDVLENSSTEESLSLLRKEIENLKGQLQVSKTKKQIESQKKSTPPVSLYEQASNHFKNKEWKQAILIYEEFRKKNPKSDQFRVATLNIGLSFKKLGLDQESSIFFKEIVDRFPQSKEAQEAQKHLK